MAVTEEVRRPAPSPAQISVPGPAARPAPRPARRQGPRISSRRRMIPQQSRRKPKPRAGSEVRKPLEYASVATPLQDKQNMPKFQNFAPQAIKKPTGTSAKDDTTPAPVLIDNSKASSSPKQKSRESVLESLRVFAQEPSGVNKKDRSNIASKLNPNIGRAVKRPVSRPLPRQAPRPAPRTEPRPAPRPTPKPVLRTA